MEVVPMSAELADLRIELLRQHDQIRMLANAVAAAADAAVVDSTVRPALLSLLGRLWVDVQAHNDFETERLHAILPKIDAWGPLRDRLMGQHHAEEHDAIVATIHETMTSADSAEMRKR